MQAFSSRPDVIPPSYLAELEKLQDRIPPFPDEDAYTVIGAELGVPASALFSELTASPIAAASLGQASTALLADLCQRMVLEPSSRSQYRVLSNRSRRC
jgi:predicted unusual protein kinase regulating ubiquinone biosynthesis (AarF/ABC1/UbiB family)